MGLKFIDHKYDPFIVYLDYVKLSRKIIFCYIFYKYFAGIFLQMWYLKVLRIMSMTKVIYFHIV